MPPNGCEDERLTNVPSTITQMDGGNVCKSVVKSRWYCPQTVSRAGAEKDLQQHAKEMASLRFSYEMLNAMKRRISSTSKAWCMSVDGLGGRDMGIPAPLRS